MLYRRTNGRNSRKFWCMELIRKQMFLRDLETQVWTWVTFGDEVWGDQNCSYFCSEWNLECPETSWREG